MPPRQEAAVLYATIMPNLPVPVITIGLMMLPNVVMGFAFRPHLQGFEALVPKHGAEDLAGRAPLR